MMKNKSLPMARIEPMIYTIRNQKVILDADLARLYNVTTKALNQAVKRNSNRFPDDFAFQLTLQEVRDIRSQFAISKTQPFDSQQDTGNRSQFVTGSQKHRDPRNPPLAFTEHGAIMAATVLNSPKAVEMSVFVVRAFVRLREELSSRRDMEKRLDQIENILLVHDSQLKDLFDKIRPLMLPPPDEAKKAIGFSVKEKRARYGTPRRKRKINT